MRRPRLFLAGVALSALASATSGAAIAPAMLVASRFGQGAGEALAAPAAGHDLDHRQALRRGTGCAGGHRFAGPAGPGGVSRADLRRLGGGVRGAAVPLCTGWLSASPILAGG